MPIALKVYSAIFFSLFLSIYLGYQVAQNNWFYVILISLAGIFLYYISGGYKHTIPVLFALTCLGGNFNLGFTISPSEWFVLGTFALIAIKLWKVEYQSNQNFPYLVYSYPMQGIKFF
jgi:hypothetical protein